jgi:hypothetical protein
MKKIFIFMVLVTMSFGLFSKSKNSNSQKKLNEKLKYKAEKLLLAKNDKLKVGGAVYQVKCPASGLAPDYKIVNSVVTFDNPSYSKSDSRPGESSTCYVCSGECITAGDLAQSSAKIKPLSSLSSVKA